MAVHQQIAPLLGVGAASRGQGGAPSSLAMIYAAGEIP
jgi:hypothetical protein